MSYGYSARTIHLNKEADHRRLGVALGRAAIELGISVTDIATHLGVSRQTVYNWFVGSYDPKASLTGDVTKLLTWFRKQLK
jgi:DNA-binding XRE family transcriptional regulator